MNPRKLCAILSAVATLALIGALYFLPKSPCPVVNTPLGDATGYCFWLSTILVFLISIVEGVRTWKN